jgi:hypothetical protein
LVMVIGSAFFLGGGARLSLIHFEEPKVYVDAFTYVRCVGVIWFVFHVLQSSTKEIYTTKLMLH